MHLREFKNDLSSLLGRACLKSFYCQLIRSHKSACLVIERERSVIGFICGSTNIHSIWSPGYKMRMLWHVLLGVIRRPSALIAVLRGIPVHRFCNQRKSDDQANLLSFAVLREYRNEGLGKKLLFEWLKLLSKQGAGRVLLFTDAREGATGFYVKHSFTLVKSIKSFGRQYDFLSLDLREVTSWTA